MSESDVGIVEQPPGLLLEFTEPGYEDMPPQLRYPVPADVAAVLTTVEAIYNVTVLNFPTPTPGEDGELEWLRRYSARSRRLGVRAIRMESPLQILLELPWPVYATGFAGLAYGISHVLGVPYRAAARFYGARDEYWTMRLQEAKSKEEWLDWKAQQAERQIPFRLMRVEETNRLPASQAEGEGGDALLS